MTVSVVIADDQELIRTGFRLILAAEPDIDVVGEAATGDEAVTITHHLKPDVVLMDIRMPDLDGIEATRRILADARQPPTKVLILTTFDLDEYVYDALRAGASGFLLKDVPARQLASAVRTVGDGDALLSPSITRRLIEQFAAPRAPARTPPGIDELTRQDQRRDRGRADRRRDHRQDACHANPDETRAAGPSAGRRARLRDRHRHPRPGDPRLIT